MAVECLTVSSSLQTLFQFLGGLCPTLYRCTLHDNRLTVIIEDCLIIYPSGLVSFHFLFSSSVLAAFYQQSDSITFEAMSYYPLWMLGPAMVLYVRFLSVKVMQSTLPLPLSLSLSLSHTHTHTFVAQYHVHYTSMTFTQCHAYTQQDSISLLCRASMMFFEVSCCLLKLMYL